MREHNYFVYILSSASRVLYVGVTGDLARRIHEHKYGAHDGFAWRNHIHRLVWIENTSDIRDAIARENQIKGWRREKKVALIEASNPGWVDLSDAWRRP